MAPAFPVQDVHVPTAAEKSTPSEAVTETSLASEPPEASEPSQTSRTDDLASRTTNVNVATPLINTTVQSSLIALSSSPTTMTTTTTAPTTPQTENKRKRKPKNPSQGKLLPDVNARSEEDTPVAPPSNDDDDDDCWTKKCEFCGEIMSISLLIPHIASTHNKENVHCPICGTVEGTIWGS